MVKPHKSGSLIHLMRGRCCSYSATSNNCFPPQRNDFQQKQNIEIYNTTATARWTTNTFLHLGKPFVKLPRGYPKSQTFSCRKNPEWKKSPNRTGINCSPSLFSISMKGSTGSCLIFSLPEMDRNSVYFFGRNQGACPRWDDPTSWIYIWLTPPNDSDHQDYGQC